jgi:hypothetical protein
MAVQNRISVSFNDQEFLTLERLSLHTQKSKAELIRMIVEEFLRDNPNRFRRKTPMNLTRQKNVAMATTLAPPRPCMGATAAAMRKCLSGAHAQQKASHRVVHACGGSSSCPGAHLEDRQRSSHHPRGTGRRLSKILHADQRCRAPEEHD